MPHAGVCACSIFCQFRVFGTAVFFAVALSACKLTVDRPLFLAAISPLSPRLYFISSTIFARRVASGHVGSDYGILSVPPKNVRVVSLSNKLIVKKKDMAEREGVLILSHFIDCPSIRRIKCAPQGRTTQTETEAGGGRVVVAQHAIWHILTAMPVTRPNPCRCLLISLRK